MSIFLKSLDQFLDPIISNVSAKTMDFFSGTTIFSNLFQSSSWLWPALLVVYAAAEINFFLVYRYYLVPKANVITEPQPVRAFGCQDGNDRFMLMRRILDRLERTCAATGEDMFQATAQYISLWFRFEPHKDPDYYQCNKKNKDGSPLHPKPPPMRRVSTICTDSDCSSSSGDDDDDHDDNDHDLDYDSDSSVSDWEDCPSSGNKNNNNNNSVSAAAAPFAKFNNNGDLLPMLNDSKLDGCEKTNIFKWAMAFLKYDGVEALLSCFFIGRKVEDLNEKETKEVKRLFDYLEDHFDIKVKKGQSAITTPRLLILDEVTSWHRPLAVYAGVYAMQCGKSIFLRMMGFSYNVSKTGLVYWYRPPTVPNKDDAPNPLLFFHGIAPGGSSIYLPMLLAGVANDGRALFIFENAAISSGLNLNFHVISEDECIDGVQEALDTYYPKGDVALMGHSFGSFQLTWMIYSPLRERIRQFALLDPVSIMLSEPDLIVNFEECTPFFKIFLSELWTNFYVRRHFSWYRNELWLDDLPDDVDVFVGLAEADQIVNGPKVLKEVQIFGSTNPSFQRQTTTAFWPRAYHGDCLYMPSYWRDIRSFFDKTNRNSIGQKKQKVC